MLKSRFTCRILAGHSLVRSFNRTYLSQEFKTTMGKRLEIPQIDRNTKKLFVQTEKLIAFEIDSFINRLPQNEDRRGEIYEQLLRLRASEYTSIAPETLHHTVINYLVSINVDDLLSILSNRLQYGIFLDAFTGCYLMDTLLEKDNFAGAAQIAVELQIQEDFENELVQALALKSSFEYVQNFLKSSETPAEDSPQTEENSDKPVKVRVKFLRNPPENEMVNTKDLNLRLIGKTISKFSSNCSNSELTQNGMLLGSVLEDRLEETVKFLKTNSNSYCKDVINICSDVLEKNSKSAEDLVNSVKDSLEKLKSTATKTFIDAIDGFITQARSKNEASLIAQQNENYEKWLRERDERFNEILTSQKRFLRQAEIEKTVSDIESEKQKLWFFETQDKLDMDIFRKQVRYPKRWFGKKKKPRAIDDNYVPPEIRAK